MEKGIERFQRQLLQLEPVEFIGVARILGVRLFNPDTIEPIPFEELFIRVLEEYKKLARRQRKNLDKILRAATKKEEDSND